MKRPPFFFTLLWASLLITSCSTTVSHQTGLNEDISHLILGPWLRDIPGSSEMDGYYFGSNGELQLVNIFSMQPDSWVLNENRLTITTHTERYPVPEATEYTIDVISQDTLSLGLNGHKTIFYRPKYTTELRNTRWIPTFIPGASPEEPAAKEPFLQFTAEDSLRGYAGCNQFSGTYSADQKRLFVGPVLTTKMYCPNMQYENAFLGALSGSSNYLVIEDQLYLIKDKVMRGTFKAMYYH